MLISVVSYLKDSLYIFLSSYQRLNYKKQTFGPDFAMMLPSLQSTFVFLISFHLNNNCWGGTIVGKEIESQRIRLPQLESNNTQNGLTDAFHHPTFP